jgi:ribonucleoside-diphosphate reductase alpha chain
MDTFATTVSVALQYGVPLRDLVNKFAHVRFEPSGFTGNAEIPIAKSIVDYIFRWLGSRFLSPDEKANLGLIDRSAMVDEPPYGSVPALTAPAAYEGPPPADVAVSTQTQEAPKSTGGTDAPSATAVATAATEGTPGSDLPNPVELAVVATNGHANGHGTANGKADGNGNGNGGFALSFGPTKVAFAAQADAPSCAECGSIMVRNGSCYKCLNCGSTSGCS